MSPITPIGNPDLGPILRPDLAEPPEVVMVPEPAAPPGNFPKPPSSLAFAPAVEYPALLNYVQLIDIEGDGAMDVLGGVGADGQLVLHVLHNDGHGVFTDIPTTTKWTFGPQSVVAGDFDGDGKGDLLVVMQIHMDTWEEFHRGLGDGNFAAPVRLSGMTGFGQRGTVAAGNIDKTGGADVIGLFDELFAWLAPSAAPVKSAIGGHPDKALSTDLGGDGLLDLIAGGNGQMGLYRGDGHGGFVLFELWSSRASIVGLADLDGDGKLDLVRGDGGSALLGRGTSFVGAGHATPLNAFAAADFDGDGHVDLAGRVDQSGPKVAISLGRGDGDFTEPYLFDAERGRPLVADFDRDGKPDIMQCVDPFAPVGVCTFLRNVTP